MNRYYHLIDLTTNCLVGAEWMTPQERKACNRRLRAEGSNLRWQR
jgi:hypothetical protein